ncbi:MAG: hypothetical protein E7331_00250 [Clostridiales bacterium]|nr:hypothetical protein [Clostridiales bacterium]
MQEINGTITLAFVEEDNKQRVIFRVFPLCTREGVLIQKRQEEFPDEGSLRIVPDKREQSTFKDRMHEINGLCAIHLVNHDGKELIKVRQNRNYAPEQGENNRFAIYSDVICDFAPEGCLEVITEGQDVSQVLTKNVVISKDKMLYGPVEAAQAAGVDMASLKPFGNDSFLLSTTEIPGKGQHTFYWNPEAIVNLRQRRNALRRKDRSGEDAPVEAALVQPEASPAKQEETPAVQPEKKAVVQEKKTVEPPKAALPKKQENPEISQEVPQEKKSHKLAKEEPVDISSKPVMDENAALPIGARLNILDDQLTFDQQLSRLEQELGSTANRLDAEDAPLEEPQQISAHFKGTPLERSVKPITKSTARPESVHHVVEAQLTQNMEAGGHLVVENPIDSLRTTVDYIWQNAEMRNQAISMFAENESFMTDMLHLFRRSGISTQATAAAMEQFSEIEAERLSLLMQLDTAKNNEKKYREEVLAALSQRLRSGVDKLKTEVASLEKSKAELLADMEALSLQSAEMTKEYVLNHLKGISAAGEKRIILSPVIGRQYEPAEMVELLRVHMNEGGYGISEDEAMSLLIHLAVSDCVCFSAPTEADAARFARIAMESLGLESVCAFAEPGFSLEVASLLKEDGNRTPTVSIQPFGTARPSGYGHKTIYLIEEKKLRQLPADSFPEYPILSIHTSARRSFARKEEFQTIAPASLNSFHALRLDSQPLLTEAEKWFQQLRNIAHSGSFGLSQAAQSEMRRFIEVASHKVRGGFLAAADAALCHWFVPAALNGFIPAEQLRALVQGLPKAMMILRMD